jgi:hypothetical protein
MVEYVGLTVVITDLHTLSIPNIHGGRPPWPRRAPGRSLGGPLAASQHHRHHHADYRHHPDQHPRPSAVPAIGRQVDGHPDRGRQNRSHRRQHRNPAPRISHHKPPSRAASTQSVILTTPNRYPKGTDSPTDAGNVRPTGNRHTTPCARARLDVPLASWLPSSRRRENPPASKVRNLVCAPGRGHSDGGRGLHGFRSGSAQPARSR